MPEDSAQKRPQRRPNHSAISRITIRSTQREQFCWRCPGPWKPFPLRAGLVYDAGSEAAERLQPECKMLKEQCCQI